MKWSGRIGALIAACALAPAPAIAGDLAAVADVRAFVHRLLEHMTTADTTTPPVPVEVRWGARRVASLSLDAPLLDLVGHDIDGDGKTELIALTTREVVVVSRPRRRTLTVIGRAALPDEPPESKPRDPVGVLVLQSGLDRHVDIVARTSEQARGAVFSWIDGALVEQRRISGFPLCGRGSIQLATGKNYFEAPAAGEGTDLPPSFYVARCRALIDPAGAAIQTFGVVGTDRVLQVSCRAAEKDCAPGPATAGRYEGVGVAFEIADVDNDGSPEVITSKGQAPGDPDRVSVHSTADGASKRVFSKPFQGGVVGLAAADLDGDGRIEVVAAVRLVGSTRVGVWTLN